MRLEVALEGMEILARHLGEAPAEWLFTYFDETLKEPAFAASSDNLLQVCLETLAKAEAYMSVYEMLRAKEWLASDMRIKLTTPDIFVGVSHDGWASQRTRIRVRFDGKLHSHLRLSCRLAWPRFQPVRLRVSSPWSAESSILVETPERFDIRIPLPTSEESWDSEVILATEDYFVPSQMQPDSQDHRKLAFRVESASLS